ncbi:Cro/Cl family transcriptional regulator [Pseudomonas protegens]|uniref:Cro/CI family transcriptional regulator n=1 Tax=Pseudomonas protegens TaxID=380021 RepID=UPI00035E009D|nr:Cro/CI family transcriptional regulator [Pseudomonas protegens]ROM29298.1 Cro/Cl family transcriptional regulator [Pseudomonas protegens]ROM36931.1 Cro/Cl family transcriptional regulator [Pseudomonas protegens]
MNMNDAIKHFGSKTKLAAALGIHPSAVTQWGDSVPESRQYQIQVMTKGKLKASTKTAA